VTRRAAAGAAGLAALAAALWLLVGGGIVNYDTLHTLVWGRDLAHGRLPDYEAPYAPTPHPLSQVVGVLLAPLSSAERAGVHGEAAVTATLVLAFLFLAALGWVVYALGAAWFGVPAGVVAAAIVLTRRPVLDFGARAYVDIPYLVLVLAAVLAETRRPRAGAPVLLLLALAGLLRPEAWLFSAAYLVWLWRTGVVGSDRGSLVRLALLAAAAPLLWALSDLIVTGDPLHSLTGTRDTAAALQRITGLDDVPLTVPRRLGEILREPVLVGAAGGGLLALAFLRRRALPGLVVGVVALVAFCVLAAAGLPILGRYLLLPAAVLAIFCGAGVTGWRLLPEGHPWRRRWAAFAVVVVALFVVFTPAQADRLTALRDALSIQTGIQDDLAALARGPQAPLSASCTPIGVPNYRPVPLLGLWLDIGTRQVVSAQDARPGSGAYVQPRTSQVADDYVLDPRDRDRRVPAPPPGFRPAGANASWVVWTRCPRPGVSEVAAASRDGSTATPRASQPGGPVARAGARWSEFFASDAK